MSYVVLARKYRPQTFEDVYGQEHITKTLSNAIASDHIAHSYLFSGPRGVGKTTVARILARMLNCRDEKIFQSGNCDSCKDIINNSAMDVIEIDGASNRGIDEIRDLRENVKFAPTKLKYKIYIIDEVHMLTEQAFNALLKTLEEPPKHVIFMFATTELYKIPDTILSRCQKFNFKLIPSATIIAKLKQLLEKENIMYDDEALSIIARAGQGSIRDSLSLLDQIISFTPEKITTKDTAFILGVINSDTLFSMTDSILTNNSKEILISLENILNQGYDIEQIAKQLREHYRILMLLNIHGELNEILNISSDNYEKYLVQAKKINLSKITRDVRIITKAIEEMKWSDYPRIVWELALVKLSQPYIDANELLKSLENMDLEKIFLTNTNSTNNEPKTNTTTQSLKSFDEKPKVLTKKTAPTKEEKVVTHNSNPDNFNEFWNDLIAHISKEKVHVSQFLESALNKKLDNNKLTLTYDTKFLADSITKNKEIIEQSIFALSNKKIKVECEMNENLTLKKTKSTTKDKTSKIEETAVEYSSAKNSRYRYTPDEVVKHEPVVQKVLDMFGGEILPPR